MAHKTTTTVVAVGLLAKSSYFVNYRYVLLDREEACHFSVHADRPVEALVFFAVSTPPGSKSEYNFHN
jgi:hypothetical protein